MLIWVTSYPKCRQKKQPNRRIFFSSGPTVMLTSRPLPSRLQKISMQNLVSDVYGRTRNVATDVYVYFRLPSQYLRYQIQYRQKILVSDLVSDIVQYLTLYLEKNLVSFLVSGAFFNFFNIFINNKFGNEEKREVLIFVSNFFKLFSILGQ